ncbi:Leucine aminopeptidase 2 [Hibiscus syriacus]|uniref:Leucine aminopeptidase 2 n=1 Tax=Hibiscus syriacus TaxID=106335 RepID=A0A6A3D771_HIBSY|nr:Leucine aminopeptidase 2 [Hibiscus syriacus]
MAKKTTASFWFKVQCFKLLRVGVHYKYIDFPALKNGGHHCSVFAFFSFIFICFTRFFYLVFVFHKVTFYSWAQIVFSSCSFVFSKSQGYGTLSLAPILASTQPANIEHPRSLFCERDDVGEWKGDMFAVGVTEKDMTKDETPSSKTRFEEIRCTVGGLLAEASSEEDFSGKSGHQQFLDFPDLDLKGRNDCSSNSVAVVLASSEGLSNESKLGIASAIASGIVLGIHEDNRYKSKSESESKKPQLKSVDILGLGTGPELEKKFKYAEDVSSAVVFGRELVNSPANVLTPAALAAEASKITSSYSDVLSANILTAEQCKELKMGSYLGVAAASDNPPHFIHLCYKPPSGPIKAKLALVGKGLTFDSGGYNIKTGPGCSIDVMKIDMGGSAAVLGAAKALGEIKPPGVEVHFIVASCENMISGTGMRPGDILTASNGKTIEVNNTDAEGRLTLADALVYACNQGVDKIVDLATLTGACIVALGPSIAGVFTPSDELAKEVFEASEISGEKFWRMPLEESYWESMKSGVADMVNTGGRQGGAITAALFLKQFVDEKVQWMHIDLAGPVWNEKKRVATGFGVSTLVEWVLKNSS